MTLQQKITLLILSLAIVWLSIDVSRSSETSCDKALNSCIKSVESKKEIIATQQKILNSQTEVIDYQEKRLETVREESIERGVWNYILMGLLVVAIIL